ncbi:MAG: hypothetical protein A2X79_08005 [Desulfuromonadaceae bacterium GWB2_53_15]|nr:MAG: hypothetical protein A2X83_05490 [Desulfuromonadales bacterium GWD2_54_10]OHB33096.1 MAG: hypothetical protein A2X79_08005 [Desulfuromonadaceae bacterium GWB2_53_15]
MVIDDFNVMGISFMPAKANAPLVVDADTPLPASVAGELFKAIAGWDPQKIKSCGCMELLQLALGSSLGILRQP